MKKVVLCLLVVFGINTAYGQEYSVYVSFNEYFPRGENNKSEFPFLWRSNKDKKILFGGFGVGMKMKKNLKSNLYLNGNISLFKFKHYDEPIQLITDSGNTPGEMTGIINEYGVGIQGGLEYIFSNRISVGCGFKTTTLISSKTNYRDVKLKMKNTYYRPILLTIPIEFSLYFKRIYLTPKYEIGILDRLRGETVAKEYGNIVSLEIGYILNHKVTDN